MNAVGHVLRCITLAADRTGTAGVPLFSWSMLRHLGFDIVLPINSPTPIDERQLFA